ncbi:VOC family protein [Streptacidiphilus sp. ASG 303]|uniref:VOC family protein n=1 Tax=Streptomycetaceae TaxID=2062 RepID=UPI001E4CA591|nr:VOC family protein [Streptacidiphilus sp. ASG 303]MCD0482126.1 VOC family protein [Streptacidiphilus sp. ASG 303]
MSGTADLAMVNIDCADPQALARFWAEVLGRDVVHSEEQYAMVDGAGGAPLGFGRVEGYRPPQWPNPEGTKQFHLDLYVDDLDKAEARCLELGASRPDHQPGTTWRVLLDPAGHPFCVCRRSAE